MAVDKHGHDNVHVLYCDTMKTEHSDNKRFFDDVQRWIDHPIEIIGSSKYSDIDEVFEKERFMSGIRGARCTVEMKKVPRFEYQQPDDIHIFGLTADEAGRISLFKENNPELTLEWNLADEWIVKDECYRIIESAGIDLPAMYRLGFKNNNCLGCVKATSPEYWGRVRKHFPEVFERRCRQSREIGVRLARLHGKRIFLDELPIAITDNSPEEDIECGPLCLTQIQTEREAA